MGAQLAHACVCDLCPTAVLPQVVMTYTPTMCSLLGGPCMCRGFKSHAKRTKIEALLQYNKLAAKTECSHERCDSRPVHSKGECFTCMQDARDTLSKGQRAKCSSQLSVRACCSLQSNSKTFCCPNLLKLASSMVPRLSSSVKTSCARSGGSLLVSKDSTSWAMRRVAIARRDSGMSRALLLEGLLRRRWARHACTGNWRVSMPLPGVIE